MQAVCAPCFCIFCDICDNIQEARSIVQSFAKEGEIRFRRGLASIQRKFEDGFVLSDHLAEEGSPGDDE